MSWVKKGLMFSPDKSSYWMQSNAQLPTVEYVTGDIFRIYFASRDAHHRSNIGYIEIDITNPKRIINISEKPVLEPGDIGCFDEHGVLPASIVNHNGKKYLYYTGWNKGVDGLFYYSNGLAIGGACEYFCRYSKAPIMARSEHDPCLVASPYVFIENDVWNMLYVSGIKWERRDEGVRPYYHIKYAFSHDGVNWLRKGDIAIDFKNENESNIARVCVVKDEDIYKAWYCYATLNNPYTIGYAESTDGIHFVRKDDLAGISLSADGYDSEMMCYPYVIRHKEKVYMFYNGNRFGKDGIALAVKVLEKGRGEL